MEMDLFKSIIILWASSPLPMSSCSHSADALKVALMMMSQGQTGARIGK
jgi:hypothetical protein